MKKLTLSAALVAAMFLGLTSCTKNDDVSTTSKSAGTARVIFGSVDEYEQLFTNPEQTDSLAGNLAARYGTYNASARLSSIPEDTLYPELLNKILNIDHIVQIDKWLIKIDLTNQQVLVLEKQYESEYLDLVNSKLSNPHILVYSIDDDVLELLQNGIINENARLSGILCSEKGTESKKVSEDVKFTDNSLPSQPIYYNFQHFLCYRKAGIYFDIHTEAKGFAATDPKFYTGWKTVYTPKFKISTTSNFKLKCGKSESIQKDTEYETKFLSTQNDVKDAHKTFYWNVKPLSKYDIYIRYGESPKYQELHITDGY